MAWMVAKLALLAIALVWGSLIVQMLPLMLAAHIRDRITRPGPLTERWLYNLLLAQDILTNVVLGGYFRTTISSELGKLQNHSRSGAIAARVVDWLFEVTTGQREHCRISIEAEDRFYFHPAKALLGFVMYCACLVAWYYSSGEIILFSLRVLPL